MASRLTQDFLVLLSKNNPAKPTFHPATHTTRENSTLLLVAQSSCILHLNTWTTAPATAHAAEDEIPPWRAQTFGTGGTTEIQQHSHLFTKFYFACFITTTETCAYWQHSFWKRMCRWFCKLHWDLLFFILSTSLLKTRIWFFTYTVSLREEKSIFLSVLQLKKEISNMSHERTLIQN